MQLSNRLFVHALLLVSQSQVSPSRKEIWFQPKGQPALRNRLVVLVSQVKHPTQMGIDDGRKGIQLPEQPGLRDSLVGAAHGRKET